MLPSFAFVYSGYMAVGFYIVCKRSLNICTVSMNPITKWFWTAAAVVHKRVDLVVTEAVTIQEGLFLTLFCAIR